MIKLIAWAWKNAGKVATIKLVMQVIWMLTFSIASNLIVKEFVKRDNYVRFHNVKMADGSEMKFWDTFIHFALQAQPMVLTSDEGDILCVHGNKDGGFQIGATSLSYQEGLDCLPIGKYHLFSCYNGNRPDHNSMLRKYIRPEATKTNHPTIMIGDGDDILVAAGKYNSYCVALISLDFKAVIKMIRGEETEY